MKNLATAALLFLSLPLALSAQKIGYANVELLLAYMPETAAMNQQLMTYQERQTSRLEAKQIDYQKTLQAAQERQNAGATQTELEQLSAELKGLENGIQSTAANIEQNIAQKRQELLQPIVEKLQNAIKDVAAEQGYEYVLNSVDGSGVSIILHGPEENDLTKPIMAHLGIQIPEEQ